MGAGLGGSGSRLRLHAVDALLRLGGVWADGQNLQIRLVVRQRAVEVAGLFLHDTELVGGLGIAGLPFERFLVPADRGAIVALLEVIVANLDALGSLVRILGMEFTKFFFAGAGMLFVVLGRRDVDFGLLA